jgi:thiamine-phosphate pyrophosphorylase
LGARRLIRCYITDRRSCKSDLLSHIGRAVRDRVDYIQIREKDLSARALLELTLQAVAIARQSATRILVNDRADVAIAAGAHGVHLRSGSISPLLLRPILPNEFLIGVSCHTEDELRRAAGADFAVYGAVFASPGKGPAIGIGALAAAVRVSPVPVLALGGITWENARECLAAGASGIAAIRLFQS